MHNLVRAAAAALSLAVAVPAQPQGYVSPSHFRTAEGTWGTTIPLGMPAQTRFLQVHDDAPGPLAVGGLAFRPDLGAPAMSFSFLCDVVVSSAITSSTTLSPTFDDNHGADKVVAAGTQLYSLKILSTFSGVGGDELYLPFSSPFMFGGSTPLCWEVRVLGNTQVGAKIDGVTGSKAEPGLPVHYFGSGCRAFGFGFPMDIIVTPANWFWSSGTPTISATIRNGPLNDLAVLVLGSDVKSWLGLALPFSLPGTPTAASRECFIYTDTLFALPTLLVGRTATLSFGVQLDPALNGVNLAWQGMARSVGANPFDVVTTNAAYTPIVAPFGTQPVGTVSNTSSAGPTGVVAPGQGAIVEFR